MTTRRKFSFLMPAAPVIEALLFLGGWGVFGRCKEFQ
jgi:hypothetical protein